MRDEAGGAYRRLVFPFSTARLFLGGSFAVVMIHLVVVLYPYDGKAFLAGCGFL